MAQQLDHLRRVFPVRQLFRGPCLRAIFWSLAGTVCFAGLLVTVFVIVALLDSQGRLSIPKENVREYQFFFEPESASDDTSEFPTSGLRLSDVGLKSVGWEYRRRPLGRLVGRLCRSSHALHQTGSALFYLTAYALAFGFALSAIVAHVKKLTTRIADKTAGQLRESLHRHALRTGISDLKNERTNEILELFTRDVERIRMGIEEWIMSLVLFPAQLLVLLVVGIMINGLVVFQCAVPLLGVWYIIRRDKRHVRKTEQKLFDQASRELALLGEGLYSSRLVRGYAMEEFEHHRFEKHLNRYQQRIGDIERLHTKNQWLARAISFACFAIVFYLIGMRMTIDPNDVFENQHLSLADATLLFTIFVLGYRPLESLANLRNLRADAAAAADNVYRYLNEIPQVGQAVGAKFLEPIQKAIEFKSVTYRDGKETILDGLNLTIDAGVTTAIVAFNDVERRTLAAMIPRFIEPNEGQVLIDSEDLAWVTLESLRAEALFVSAENSAFSGTVLENIGGNEERFSLSQVTESAKACHAHHFVQKLTQGYETVIGAHGEQLRLSELFRLSLSRAHLRNPAMLIIDEPSAEMTDDEKALLEDGIRRASEGRTVVILANRLSTLRNVDRIILLNRGQVEAMGSHSSLVKKSALYQHWEYINFNEFRKKTDSSQNGNG